MSEILFAKMTKERKKEFQICTKIVEINEEKKVIKEALYEEGVPHIVQMKEYSTMFKKSILRPVECSIEKKQAIFPYVEGKSLHDILLFEVKQGNVNEAYQILNNYKSMIYQLGENEKKFETSLEFERVFGKISGLESVLSAQYVNVDNILENIIVNHENYTMIDYEWMFNFYIPYNFVIYRAIIDLYINYADVMNAMMSLDDMLCKLDISENERNIYNKMNMSFNDYVFNGKQGYSSIIQQYRKNTLGIEQFINTNEVYAQLYYDDGSGFSEENSIIQSISMIDYANLKTVKTIWCISENRKIKKLRFDPINYSGFIEILNIIIINKKGEKISWKINKAESVVTLEEKGVFCLNNDPKIVMDVDDDRIYKIIIEMRITPNTNEEVYKKTEQLYSHMDRMQQHIERLKCNNNQLQKYIASLSE